MSSNLTIKCPWEDCQNQVAISDQAQEADVIVCRTGEQAPAGVQGCSRNIEIIKISREDGKPAAVELAPLAVSEDWGE